MPTTKFIPSGTGIEAEGRNIQGGYVYWKGKIYSPKSGRLLSPNDVKISVARRIATKVSETGFPAEKLEQGVSDKQAFRLIGIISHTRREAQSKATTHNPTPKLPKQRDFDRA